MQSITVSTGYTPRQHQVQMHRGLGRFNVLVAHRRFGKTVGVINHTIDACLRNPRVDPPPHYAYVAPLYNQAKDIAWSYLKRYTAPIPGTTFNEAELRADLPGGRRIRLYGADNPDRLRGLYLDGVVLDEFAQMQPRVWAEVVRPTLTDYKGWAIFIGTPMGKNAFWDLYSMAVSAGDPLWRGMMFTASETGVIDAEELGAAQRTMTPEQYAQEFECSFEAAIVGAYYGKELQRLGEQKRIANVPYDPRLPVTTAWDLGIGDSTAIWFCQQASYEVRLIDYYEASGEGMGHYAKMLKEKPYVYDQHILPFDADHKLHDEHGSTRTEILYRLGIRGRVLQRTGLEDGIESARTLLPRCWFDEANTARGLEALRQYRREWDDVKRAFRDKPLHDWTSHAADAFRYLAVGLRPPQGDRYERRAAQPTSWMAA